MNFKVYVSFHELVWLMRRAIKKARRSPNRKVVCYRDEELTIYVTHETRKYQKLSGHGTGKYWLDYYSFEDSNGNELCGCGCHVMPWRSSD